MKTRSFLSLIFSAPLFLAAAPAVFSGACSSSSGGSPDGGTGAGGNAAGLDPNNLLSDFSDTAAATVVAAGTPPRNGYWYTYNDMSATCVQMPANGAAYVGETPTTPSSGPSGGMALHAQWNTCSTWGAGVGADLNQPPTDGGTYMGLKVPYDLTGYTGITFWAMAAPGTDTKLRVKLPMTVETKTTDGGKCVDNGTTSKCSDDWGQAFQLPNNGNWSQITVKFSDTSKFKQEGWGVPSYAWNPADVTSIQIQSVDMGEKYDFWIDDVYLTK
jgi:hypothetical protein